MAINSLKDFLMGMDYVGIELFTDLDKEMIAISKIQRKKGELNITSQLVTEVSSNENLYPVRTLPVALVINTRQVIHKEVNSIDSTDGKLLHKTFPNIKWDEFYYEIWRSKEKSIVAIARKDYVDDTIRHFKSKKTNLAFVTLGVCSLSQIEPFIGGGEISTNHQIISLNPEKDFIAKSESKKASTYFLNGLSIPNKVMLPFCGVLKVISDVEPNSGSIISESSSIAENFIQDALFGKGLKILLTILFLALLTNFIAFSYYFSRAQETHNQVLLNQSSIDNLNKLKSRVAKKELRARSLLNDNSPKFSVLVNEIAKTVPKSVTLQNLTLNPIQKKIKPGEKILFDENMILITGQTVDNEAVTTWIEKIENLNFTDYVAITHFGKDEESESKSQFSIIIKMNKNEVKQKK